MSRINFCTLVFILIFVSRGKDMSQYHRTSREGVWYAEIAFKFEFVNDYSGKRNAEHFQAYHNGTKVNQK